MIFSMNRVRALFVVAAAALSLGACASGARPDFMALTTANATGVTPAALGQAGYQKLRVSKVQGGSQTNPAWMSNVSDEDFRTALEASLKGFNYTATDASGAAYDVVASITDLQRPMMGLDMSVTIKVRYSITPIAGGAPIFDETLSATGTAKMGEAFAGSERLQKAIEYAVRANIQTFIQRLSTVVK
jgi:hypothetical protein